MSGGHWNYAHSHLNVAADDIEMMIRENDTPNRWGMVQGYTPSQLQAMQQLATVMRAVADAWHELDYAVSADTSMERFQSRWAELMTEIGVALDPTLYQAPTHYTLPSFQVIDTVPCLFDGVAPGTTMNLVCSCPKCSPRC